MLKLYRGEIMKRKIYIINFVSHMAVLLALLTPVIRITEIRMSLSGEKEDFSHYVSIIQFIKDDIYSFTSIYMLFLTLVHIVGIVNAVIGIVKEQFSHFSINVTIICGFASALMGALHLYSKSYVLFTVCALSFLAIAVCSIKLVKMEG